MRITNYNHGGSQIVTLLEVKSHLNILHDDDDTLLLSLLNPAQAQVENDTDTVLTNSTYTDTFFDESEYILAKKPVSQVISILADEVSILLSDAQIYLKQVGNSCVVMPRNHKKLVVQYRCEPARYQTLAIARQATLMLIASMYLNREAVVTVQQKHSPMYINLIYAMRDE